MALNSRKQLSTFATLGCFLEQLKLDWLGCLERITMEPMRHIAAVDQENVLSSDCSDVITTPSKPRLCYTTPTVLTTCCFSAQYGSRQTVSHRVRQV